MAGQGHNLCPFSWVAQDRVKMVEGKRAGCFGSFLDGLNGPPKIPTNISVWEPTECLGSPCKLWDQKKADCTFNNLGGAK